MLRRVLAATSMGCLLLGCASGAGAPLHGSAGGAISAQAAETGEPLAVATDPVAADEPIATGPWVGAAAASSAVLPGVRETAVGVWVDVPKVARESHAPVMLSLVVDTSGSMANDKIANAKRAASQLVSGLHEGDMVSIHTFDDEAVQRLPATVIDSMTRARVVSTISELRVGGGTNLFEGLRQGAFAAMDAPATHAVRRVVVISDGIANVGPSSPEILGTLAEQGSDRGVQVTALGVGLDYDEATLNALAVRSSGRLYHLTDSVEMASILVEELKLLQGTMATNAFLEIVPAPGVAVLGVDGARFEGWQQNGVRVPLGTMFAGQHREMLLRVRVDAPASGSHPLASVRLHFRDPSDGNLERVQEVVARFDVTQDPAVVAQRTNGRTQAIMAMVEAGQIAVRAAQDINDDRFADADRELKKAQDQLLSTAQQVKSKKERDRLMGTAKTIADARQRASAAAAAPPAAKPAMKRTEALELNSAGMDVLGF